MASARAPAHLRARAERQVLFFWWVLASLAAFSCVATVGVRRPSGPEGPSWVLAAALRARREALYGRGRVALAPLSLKEGTDEPSSDVTAPLGLAEPLGAVPLVRGSRRGLRGCFLRCCG